jgi:membrane protein YfhO/6-pyruvoyl-tetrahydropterin synthase-like protein
MHKLPRGLWPLLAVLVAVVPVGGVFTLTRLFVVRDLALTFHSRFLFVRHSIFSGSFPFWDPYAAAGQAAVNDALFQLFHLPSLVVRLLGPETVAYNVWVALPIPLSALGMYLFLRRQLSPLASAFGAVAFAVSGPIVSTANFPNLSWSIATVPYVFWALDRVFARRSATAATLLAFVVSCQALAGEPVSLVATVALAAAYAVLIDGRWRDVRGVAITATGIAAGLLLSAIQYVPLVLAGRASMRSTMTTADFWLFHPLLVLELFVPHFFGDYFSSNLKELAWMVALNSDRDPFYYTMYLGVPIVLLAAVAIASGRPQTRFWTIAIVAFVIVSLGSHTPVYPILQALIPPLRMFRFPVKYLSLAAFGLATLAAMTLQWLIDGQAPRRAVRIVLLAAGLGALVTYVAIAWVLVAPALPARAFFHLALWANVPAPMQGAEYLLIRARPLLTALLLKLIAATFLVGIAASVRREARLALAVLGVFAVVDLLASNSTVNPTADPSLLAEPAWLQQIPRDMHERVYVGGRLEGYVNVFDVDAPKYAAPLEGYSAMEQRYVLAAQLVFEPSGPRLREALSYDLPLIWSLDYARMVGLFKFASREERLRFLTRVGTRFVILPGPPFPGAPPLARLLAAEQLQLYDFNPAARRVYVVPDALMGPNVLWQIEGMFQARFNPASGVLVSEPPPPPAGTPGMPVPASAEFIEDGLNRVVVRARLPGDGYLALMDSYTPDWRVDVDGRPAPLMRANGLFRAVHLVAGTHVVTFTYHPSMFYLGARITGATAAALALWCLVGLRRAKQGAPRAASA